jgi:hypothetical protein
MGAAGLIEPDNREKIDAQTLLRDIHSVLDEDEQSLDEERAHFKEVGDTIISTISFVNDCMEYLYASVRLNLLRLFDSSRIGKSCLLFENRIFLCIINAFAMNHNIIIIIINNNNSKRRGRNLTRSAQFSQNNGSIC